MRLAEGYRRAGMDDEAVAVLAHGLAATPEHLSGRVLQGRLALDRADLAGARRLLEDVLAALPGHYEALLGLAEVERASGAAEAERLILEELRELAPEPAVLVRLAELDGEDARPRMPPARRPTAAPMTRPSAPVPRDGEQDPTRADTIPSGPPARPGMFVRPPAGSTGTSAGSPDPSVSPRRNAQDPFVNATMAELLASQGDLDGALNMFAELVAREPGRKSHRERFVELGGAAERLPPEPEAVRSTGAAGLEQALRDLVEGD